jgi:hypothetical protein
MDLTSGSDGTARTRRRSLALGRGEEMTDLGSQFVAALAAKDTDRLVGLFAPNVDFRAMTLAASGRRTRLSEW